MIKLISSNILFDSEDERPSNWQNRRKILSNLLLEHQPKIIGTQEGKIAQLKDLESLLTGFKMVDLNRNWITTRMYPTIYLHSDIELLDSNDIWLSHAPYIPGSSSFNSMFPRVCTWAKVLIQGSEKLIVNCHLDHLDTDTRENQIKVLIKEIKKINSSNIPIILMGDFNEGPMGTVRKQIQNSSLNLQDPWLKLKKVEEASFHKFLKEDPPKGFFGERIDWILMDRNLKCNRIELLKNSVDDLYPSDHYPLLAEIEL
jgi:endonuclease/exonuclease/phosphatase family metal-dependent hydrolase